MINKPLHTITAEDIISLIDDEIPESRKLDYKQKPSDNNDLVKDITAFANAEGGDLIYGISERKADGQNTSLPGELFDVGNVDVLKQKINNMLQGIVKPRISPPGIHAVMVKGKTIVIVRIAKSWLGPHMVNDKFFCRSDAGNYTMDVDQLREAFSASERVERKLKDFHQSRIVNLEQGKTPLNISGPRWITHVVPAIAFDSKFRVDVRAQAIEVCHPVKSFRSMSPRYNAEGRQLIFTNDDGKCGDYIQFLRNGVIEHGSGHGHGGDTADWSRNTTFPLGRIEISMILLVEKYFVLAEQLSIPTPYHVMLTLCGFQDKTAVSQPSTYSPSSLNRQQLTLLELMIEDREVNIDKALRPLFDELWQAFGLHSCPNYNGEKHRQVW